MIFIAVTGGQWIPKGNNNIALKRAIARKWAALTRLAAISCAEKPLSVLQPDRQAEMQ